MIVTGSKSYNQYQTADSPSVECFHRYYNMLLNRTKECNQEWYTEIYYETMKDRDDDILLSGTLRDDGQGSIHRSGTTRRDGSKITEPTDHQWGTQQSHNLAGDVLQQGDCS